MTATPHKDLVLYHGLMEVTTDHIRMTPDIEPPELKEEILADFLVTASNSDWRDANGSPPMLSPGEALHWLADATYESVRDYDEDEAAIALACEALADGPYTAVRYALSLRRECFDEVEYSALLMSEEQAVAFRVGTVWRSPGGVRLTDEGLAALTQQALETVAVRTSHRP